MKVFYIPSDVGFFHESIDQAIIQTLKELKIEVSVYHLVKTPNLNYLSILNKIKPDLILTLHGNFLKRDIMKNIHEQAYKTAIWFVDDPYEIDNTTTYATWFDHVFTIEEACIPIYQKSGVKSVHWLPLCTWPERFQKITVETKYQSDICIIGTAFDKRQKIIDSLSAYLLSKNTKIIGRWWERLKNYQHLKGIIINKLTPPEEAAKYYNGAKININIHRTHDDQTAAFNKNCLQAETPNNRTFDIAACNAFQLIDYRKKLPNFYIPNQEIVIFQNTTDLKRKIEYYLAYKGERKKIAQAAREKTINYHTFRKRLEKLITIVRGK